MASTYTPNANLARQASIVLAHRGPDALRRFWARHAPLRVDPHDDEPGYCPECCCPDCDNPLGKQHAAECNTPTLAGC